MGEHKSEVDAGSNLMLCDASIQDIVRELEIRKLNYVFACGLDPFKIEVDYAGIHGEVLLAHLTKYVAYIEAWRYVKAYGSTLIHNTSKE